MIGLMRNNALYRKEVTVLLRTWRAMGVLLAYLLILGGLTMVLWPQAGRQSLAGQSSDTLFTALCLGQLAMLVLVTPAFSANAITYEKERNTLDVLYGTLLTGGQIFWAKLAGAFTVPLLLVLSSLPFAALAFQLGGITVGDVVLAYGLLVLSGLLVATLGMAVSSYVRHSGTAAVIVYVAVIVLSGVVVVPAAMLIKHAGRGLGDALHFVRSLSPFQAMASALHPEWSNYGDYRVGQYWPSWVLFLSYSVAGIVALLVASFVRLREPQVAFEAHAARDHTTAPTRGRRIARRIFYLVDAGRPRRSLGLWSNAVFLKELRTSRAKSLSWLIRAVYLSLVVSLVLAITACIGSPMRSIGWMGQVLVIFQMTLLILLGPSMSASSISGEIENATWEGLRMTRISVPSLVLGKLLASVLPLLLSVAAMLPAYGAVAFIDRSYVSAIGWVALLGATTALFCSACGLFASSIFSRTSRANALAYGIVGVFFVVTLLALLLQGTVLSRETVRFFYVVNPMIVGLEIMGLEQLSGFHLLAEHLRVMGTLTLLLLIAAFGRVLYISRPA